MMGHWDVPISGVIQRPQLALSKGLNGFNEGDSEPHYDEEAFCPTGSKFNTET